MDLRKNSLKKPRKNVYKTDPGAAKKNTFRKTGTEKKAKEPKENVFDKINFGFFKKYQKVIVSVLSSFLIMFVVIFGGINLYSYITKSDNFLLEEINITGENYLTEEEVTELAGLQKNTNILQYKIDQIEANLLKSDWIQDVKITRSLPSKFTIEIQERKPIFVVLNNKELYYLDNKAQYIAKVEKNKFIGLPVLYINNATMDEIKLLPDFINELETTKFAYSLNEISWVSISPLYGFELFVEANNLTLQIDTVNYEENIKNLISVLDDLKKRKELNKVRKIRAAFNKVMIIKE